MTPSVAALGDTNLSDTTGVNASGKAYRRVELKLSMNHVTLQQKAISPDGT